MSPPTLIPVSGVGSKSPACFLVETGAARVLLDLGYGPLPSRLPDVSGVGRVDAVILSHSHRDHAGGLELLSALGNPRVYATEFVRRTLPQGVEHAALPLQGVSEICGVRVTTGRNGHAPGGVWIHLDVSDGLLYMGDYSVESNVYPFDAPPAAATLIADASYGDYDTALETVLPTFERLYGEGPVLLPMPAAGRAADIALHALASRGVLPHVDDAVRSALAQLAADAALVREDVKDTLARIARDAPTADRPQGVVIAGGGDGASGRAGELVSQWEKEKLPHIVFTGYLPPGTPAERLTQSGRARYIRWNVHPRLSDNVELAASVRARTVVPAFGDAKHVERWKAAYSPANVALHGPVPL